MLAKISPSKEAAFEELREQYAIEKALANRLRVANSEERRHLYREVYSVYICITPNRLSGPHDISKYFDETATGFHLKALVTS